MKKFLPFVFPLVALVIVLFLAVRWYNAKTSHPQDKIADYGDTIKVENLPMPDQNNIRQMAKDVKSVDLKGANAQGEVRYEVANGKFNFTVSADLPPLTSGVYQVWFQQPNGNGRKKILELADMKGGFIGSASVDSSILPVDVVVSKEMQNDNNIETVLMSGTVPAESTR